MKLACEQRHCCALFASFLFHLHLYHSSTTILNRFFFLSFCFLQMESFVSRQSFWILIFSRLLISFNKQVHFYGLHRHFIAMNVWRCINTLKENRIALNEMKRISLSFDRIAYFFFLSIPLLLGNDVNDSKSVYWLHLRLNRNWRVFFPSLD